MKLQLQRDKQTERGTTGRLLIDGAQFCVTLERSAAQFGDSHPCIPAGEYHVVLYHSPHFGRAMPLLVDVPGRSGIEIHWGNYVENTEGCILVGASKSMLPDRSPAIWTTRATFDRLFGAIQGAIADGITIDVRDPTAEVFVAQAGGFVAPLDRPEAG